MAQLCGCPSGGPCGCDLTLSCMECGNEIHINDEDVVSYRKASSQQQTDYHYQCFILVAARIAEMTVRQKRTLGVNYY